MEDILIVSSRDSQAAALWVNYFSTCFDQITKQKERPSLKVVHVGVEEVGSVTGLEQRLANVKLHVVIVCPQLLEAVLGAHAAAAAALFRMLRPDRTIAMLLGVTDTQLTDQHHAAMHSYRQWQRHAVGHDQDQDFAREFLSSAMGILARAARQQHAAALEQRASFSVLPKKVKHSQNRLVVLLTEPLAREDVVKVSVDRNGELLEVKTVKRRNPYTLKFVMPDSCLEMSLIVQVLVEKNGNVLGARPVKCESRLRELDQILRSSNSPLEFMCQTLGLSPTNKEQLDNWMVNSFQRNVPPHFNLLAGPSGGLGAVSVAGSGNGGRHPHAHEEFPTLLHFAARFGLEKLSWALLEGPGGEAACELRNVADLSPAELAERAGHTKLASALRGYMQMNEFTNMYSQLKEMSQINPAPATTSAAAPVEMDEDEYLLPRPAEQTYSIPPPARPCPRPITGYLEMQRSSPLREKQSESESTPTPSASNKLPSEANNISHNETTHNVHEDKVQAELAEIINDFKNNVFTLAEVEQLVQNWRNRNDVQKSFKEKEEQLNMMRRQYDRIQQVMKEEMKKATPFDRFKNLFSRRAKNKDGSEKKCEPPLIENKNANDSCSNHRPISSLSLQSTASSSSSGRMSTLSGCSAASLGDSGTHSDHEDRKHLMRQPSSDHEYFEIADPKKDSSFNYLVPPAPKPVYKYNQLKHNVVIERPPHPGPRPETPQQSGEYYIQFPPSGLPVNALLNPENKSKSRSTTPEPLNEYINPLEEPSSEYINIPAAGAAPQQVDDVSSSDALPEYMNFSPPPRNT